MEARQPLRARKVVLVAAGDGVGYLSGASYLSTFASTALLHRVVLQVRWCMACL
jgi:hypothetical protein